MNNERRPPLADLYTDEKPDSLRARVLLQEKGIMFDEWISPDDYVPEGG